MRKEGLEPSRCYPQVPETCASTSSATFAGREMLAASGFEINGSGSIIRVGNAPSKGAGEEAVPSGEPSSIKGQHSSRQFNAVDQTRRSVDRVPDSLVVSCTRARSVLRYFFGVTTTRSERLPRPEWPRKTVPSLVTTPFRAPT